ncbi:MAG: acetyl-CoA C-acyltransferase [Flavobacteriaceae bacterium]|nr:acetyl-CoA C-acyltransferase [Flavobacteriaceae bacterium]
MPKEVVIVSAVRTPIGSFMGSLSKIPAPKLGAIAIKGAIKKIDLDTNLIDEVLMGHVVQSGVGQAPARQAAIFAGIPDTVPCTTVNKVCASGMKTVIQAAQSISIGDRDIVVAGGMENMSLIPHYVGSRNPKKFGSIIMDDGMQKDGLTDAFNQKAMGVLADMCAKKFSLTREKQDNYAIKSYKRSLNATKKGLFEKEIIKVEIPQKNGEVIYVSEDEELNNIKLEKIPKLKAAFTSDGTVTAANASTINDGAAALILMSREKAKFLNLKPIASILSSEDTALDPDWFTIAPSEAIPKALKKINMSINDIDYFELNEAFSAVALANMKILNLDSSKVNVNGGAVSIGHPLGCSGARIIVTLLNVLEQNNGKIGAAAICNGGGGASAMIVKLV